MLHCTVQEHKGITAVLHIPLSETGFLLSVTRALVQPYMSSWRSSKEGDLPLCVLEKREILHEAIPRHLFHPFVQLVSRFDGEMFFINAEADK